MGEVIPMFKNNDPAPPGEEETFALETALSDELEQSIHDVHARLDELWKARSREELAETIRDIKAEVRGWPDG